MENKYIIYKYKYRNMEKNIPICKRCDGGRTIKIKYWINFFNIFTITGKQPKRLLLYHKIGIGHHLVPEEGLMQAQQRPFTPT